MMKIQIQQIFTMLKLKQNNLINQVNMKDVATFKGLFEVTLTYLNY